MCCQIISQSMKRGSSIGTICGNISRAHKKLYKPKGYGAIDDDSDEADSLLAAYRLGNEQLVYLLSQTYGMASCSTFFRNIEKVPKFLSCSGELNLRTMKANLEAFVYSRTSLGVKCAWVIMVRISLFALTARSYSWLSLSNLTVGFLFTLTPGCPVSQLTAHAAAACCCLRLLAAAPPLPAVAAALPPLAAAPPLVAATDSCTLTVGSLAYASLWMMCVKGR